MEAKVQKKPLEGKFNTWRNRLWRIKDRRLICYKAECTEWVHCVPSKVKLEVDIAKMTSASFHPKSNPKPNQLLIKHPKIAEAYGQGAGGGLILRFTDKEENMAAWLKVLTSWSVDKEKNRIYVAIPSNFSYAIWSVLNALYEHPSLLKSEGIFRKETTDSRVKQRLCNDLLYEKISMTALKEDYNNVYLLANALKYLLTMLPSSIFGDQNFEELMDGIKLMGIGAEEKKGNDDDYVSKIPKNKLLNLKARIDAMYASSKYKHRYGLISLILHLLKQVTQNTKGTRMTCDALANMFSMCFESKEWAQTSLLRNPLSQLRSIPLVKVLIYHSYFLFPEKEWQMEEVVVAEAVEAKTLELYHELQLTKKQRRARVKSFEKIPVPPPTKHFDRQSSISRMQIVEDSPPPQKITKQSTPSASNHVQRSKQPQKAKQPESKKPTPPETAAPPSYNKDAIPAPPTAPPPPSKPVPKKPPPPQSDPPPDAVAAVKRAKAAAAVQQRPKETPPRPRPQPKTVSTQLQGTGSRNETTIENTNILNTRRDGGASPRQLQRLEHELKKTEASGKQLKLENIDLKTQILDLERKLREKSERCSDLEHQVQLKDKVLKKLNQQVIDGKIQELERLLQEKDTNIQSLRQEVLTMAMQKSAQKKAEASAPMALPSEQLFYDRDVHGLSLEQKLKQRPSWVELNQRGILLTNPLVGGNESKKARKKHRRTASQKLRSMLEQRPTKEELEQNNIWREEATTKMIDDAVAMALRNKLEQRPDWQEVKQRGILLDDPMEEVQTTQKKRKDHKRNASLTLKHMLINRPSPEELEEKDIIDSNTAALFFGASPQEIVKEDTRTRQEIEQRLALKLADRPKLDEDSMVLISTNAQLKEMEVEIGTLRSEMKRLRDHSHELEESHKSLSTRAQKHQRKESEATEELAQLGQQLHNDAMQLEHLKEENQRMSLAYDLAKEDGEKYREEATTLKERIEALEGRTQKTQETQDLLKAARERLTELDAKVKENESLQSELAFYKKETERMEVELNMQQQNYVETKQLNKELQAAIAKEKEKVKHLSQQFDAKDIAGVVQEQAWEEEIDQLKDQLTNQEKEKSALREERSQLMEQLTTVEASANSELSQREKVLQDEQQRVQTLQRELQEIKQSMDDGETIQKELNDVREEVDTLRERNEMYERERKELEAKQMEMERIFKEKENGFESEMDRLRQNQNELENEISKLKVNQDSFVNEIDTLRESKMMLVISTAQEIDALRSQIKMFSKGNWNGFIHASNESDSDDIDITTPAIE